jgi:cell wall-associated NlpC family hydrolase
VSEVKGLLSPVILCYYIVVHQEEDENGGKQMKNRIISLILCLTLLIGADGTVFAADVNDTQQGNTTEIVVMSDQSEGQDNNTINNNTTNNADDNSANEEEDSSKVTNITLNSSSVSLHIGKTTTLKATVLPNTAKNRNVTWSVSDKSIATVSESGVVTAKNTGSCKVYCTAADGSGIRAVCKVTVKKRAYTRSSKYYQIQSEITLPSGGYNLSRKNIGLKVIKVNQKLFGSTNARYSSATYNAVKRFQRKHNLKATGVVNLKTWLAMGYSKSSWYDLGTYVTPMKVNGASKRSDYIQAMLKTAQEYAKAGTKYRVGCSGKPGTYVDCSGLIFQCLYSAGINPKKNIVDHALAVYEYTSRYLAADNKLGKRVSSRYKKKGDLLFYGSPVYHVAIYAGNGYIYDSWPGRGVTKRKFNRPVSYVIRVF